jgi:glycosyltransferase involved in cell wall biosynthesis
VQQHATYNILCVAATPFFVDRGGHIHIYEQARALQKLGNRVTMVTYHIGRDVPDLDIRRIINIPWYKKTDAGPSYQKPYLATLLLLKALKVARAIKPDIVHAHGWDSTWVAWWLRKLLGIPFIFDMQGSFSGEITEHGYCPKKGPFYEFLGAIERRTLLKSPVVVTSSTQICQQTRSRFSLNPDHIWPILDGVDTEEFSPEHFPPEPALRAQLGLPAGKQVIVYMGLLKPYQGVDDMIEAARVLVYARGCTDAHFLVLGFPDEDLYRAKAAEKGLAEFMTFTGKVDYHQTGRYLALADLAIAPKIAMTEGDAKIYFYMAMGLPVVAYERPASVEILGDLGFYARLNDPVDLARALHEALLQPDLLKARGAANRQKAVDDYSWTAVARRIMEAYQIAQDRMPHRKHASQAAKMVIGA